MSEQEAYVVGCWGGAWTVRGDDTWTFLQSQAANDLGRGQPHPLVWTLWLDRKGHPLAATWVRAERNGEAELRADTTPAPGWPGSLEATIIADDVEIEACGSRWMRLTLEGGAASAAVLAAQGLAVPQEGGTALGADGAVAWRSREVPGAWEVDVPAENFAAWQAALAAAGMCKRRDDWRTRKRITARVPAVPLDIGPEDLPQEGGLDRTGVSFTKGCYLGQEVMSRLRVKGRARRQLCLVQIAPEGAPEAGLSLYADGGRVGSLRSFTAVNETGGQVGFALLKSTVARAGAQLNLADPGGPSVIVTAPIPEPIG